ncbi:MAG: hypothetical protein H7061_13605 [Bdellovibrionaceae bacterium]|nr:hypothetical protein [Bdellovibrio sp.]
MNFKNVTLKGLVLLFSAVLISTIVNQIVDQRIDDAIRAPEGLSNAIWYWGAISLLSTLFFPLLFNLISSQLLISNLGSVKTFFNEKFELGCVETLRAWGKCFLWTFVFIIPGIVAFTNYFMTPFIVLFSKKYAHGEVDALKYSTQLTKMFFWRLQLWLTVFYFLIPLSLSVLLDEYRLFAVHPLSAFICILVETYFILLFHYLILQVFLKNLAQIETAEVVTSEVVNGVTV